ncbi:MAG: tRNA (adenosine(37)-N6)-threonylcarbamoyltransferase complex dimerization subunit type 1 TsaB [Asticcacaulis sp.]|nr:tRNA (adenosine(37)-N6)-threonylcarbamoyltransferase complex dimerization subunit type 1 TsaB [Asticcacaulis sp.]
MSTVLAIDTSLNACSAGLFRDGKLLVAGVDPMQRGHQERLPVMVAELFREVGLKPSDLGHVGVTLGPGSFTGLRVGLSFAKGVASGLGLKLRGIGTLEALNAHADLAGKVPLAVINGGRGALYVRRGRETPVSTTFSDLAGFVQDHPVDVLTGPAVNEVKAQFRDVEIFHQDWPSLEALAALTLAPGHDDVTPHYMRGADAVASTRGIISLDTLTQAAS